MGTPSPPQQPQTWSYTKDEELQQLFNHKAVTEVTNSQRLAHPWKIQRREDKKRRKHELSVIIDKQVEYIENSTQTSPPQIRHQWCYQVHTSIYPTVTNRRCREDIGPPSQQPEQQETRDLTINERFPITDGESMVATRSRLTRHWRAEMRYEAHH